MGKKNQSLQNIIKGQLKIFNDPDKDDKSKKTGLNNIIKKLNLLKKNNNWEEEYKKNSNELKEVKEALKGSTQFKEQLDELDSILAKSDPSKVTPSTPKAEIKNTESVGNKPKTE